MRIAVIGLGSIGQRHVRNFRALGCDVITYDVNPSVSDAPSLEYALRGSDGVVIATPPETHTEIAWHVLAAGASVMIEKPVALDETDLGHLFKAYETAGLVHMVAYPWRYDVAMGTLRDRLSEVGQPLTVRTWYAYDTGNATARTMGPLFDCSHAIDYLRWILGDVIDLTACTEGGRADVSMRFSGGVIGSAFLSLDTPLRCEWEIAGTKGRLWWNRAVDAPQDINTMYLAEARHFLACIRGEAKPLSDGWEGRETLRVCLAAQRAARERRWIAR